MGPLFGSEVGGSWFWMGSGCGGVVFVGSIVRISWKCFSANLTEFLFALIILHSSSIFCSVNFADCFEDPRNRSKLFCIFYRGF